ncbi:MAG: putative MarR family transcriptional regulator [Jatrophihabitantaceae bacterium]|nr:putative MarR family transcriptional regulator [Jatrophihabitantaceae bacterium]
MARDVAAGAAVDDAELVSRLRIAVAKISRSMDRQVGAGEMTRTQIQVLGTAVRRGPLRLSELAELEGLNPTMLSRIIAKLDAGGYIRRLPDPDDQRAVQIEATPEGARVQRRLRDERSALLSARLGQLPSGTSAQLIDALPALEELADAMLRRTPQTTAAGGAS